MGRFKKEKSGSFGECSNKYVSFDFAADSPIDQFFVIFKWKQTAADGELPEVKMYAEMESWKWQVKGDFFNYMGRKRLLAPKATCNWLGTGLAGTVMMVWMLLWGVNTQVQRLGACWSHYLVGSVNAALEVTHKSKI